MANLPLNLQLPQMQKLWAALINPFLANPIISGLQINNIVLVASTPYTVNHLLGRQMQGWFLVDRNAAAEVYRTQPFNSKTLTIESNANVTINLWVY